MQTIIQPIILSIIWSIMQSIIEPNIQSASYAVDHLLDQLYDLSIIRLFMQSFRSSHRRCFDQKSFLKLSQNLRERTKRFQPQPAWDVSERSQLDLHWEDIPETSQKHLKRDDFLETSLRRLKYTSKKISFLWRL